MSPTDSSDAPRWIKPMKAISGPLPAADKQDEWATELKWDGMRLHVQTVGGTVSLRSSSGRDVTSSFPELAELGSHIGVDAILDGEAVVFDGGETSFAHLQHRIHVAKPTSQLLETYPVVFIGFDLLWLEGQDATSLPYLDRRRLLADVLHDDPRWKCPPHSLESPQLLYDLAKARNLEGVVCKRIASPYKPGRRSEDWVKTKVRLTAEFVVGGIVAGTGSLEGHMGSLAVGVYDESGNLHFAGRVGSGLNEKFRALLETQLVAQADCPFVEKPALEKAVSWVQPTSVVQVAYGRWDDGAQLWHPTFLGIRPDKDPHEVRRD